MELKRDTRVAHAVGMICVQADCTIDQAESKLRDRAAIEGRRVEEVALEVIECQLRVG